METKLLSIGAEATIEKKEFIGKEFIQKKRIPKKYRHPALDKKLRKERTVHEARIMHEVKKWGIKTPILYLVDTHEATIFMEYIEGEKLKNILNDPETTETKKRKLCSEFGKNIAILHKKGIIHGDLTTSNVIVTPKESAFYLIDFGLAFHSKKEEDKAVDLINLKKTFTATHNQFEEGWKIIQQSYIENGGKKETLQRAETVEKRIRYA